MEKKSTKKIFLAFISLILIIIFTIFFLIMPKIRENQEEQLPEPEKSDLIYLETPRPNAVIKNPLIIKGKARGIWFFEASFPIILVNWDGLIIAESYANAQSDWMTEEFVPFEATLEFESPYKAGDPDFMKRGALVLKKDNPSGLPQYDDALEIPIMFEIDYPHKI